MYISGIRTYLACNGIDPKPLTTYCSIQTDFKTWKCVPECAVSISNATETSCSTCNLKTNVELVVRAGQERGKKRMNMTHEEETYRSKAWEEEYYRKSVVPAYIYVCVN
jgi:hypothetical protein